MIITNKALKADFPRGTVNRKDWDKFLVKHYEFTETELDYVREMMDLHDEIRNVYQGDDEGTLNDLLAEIDPVHPEQWEWLYGRIVTPGEEIIF